MKTRLLLSLVPMASMACGPKCPEPQYEGKASDEAYLTMVDAEGRATADAAKAPTLDFADGASFSAGTLPTFRWTSTLTASRAPAPLHAPSPSPSKPRWNPLELLSPATAWAHLPPVTGSIFWFKISVPGEACPVELLSTRSEWTPTDAVWATLSRGTGPRVAKGYSAYLTENRITEGPFKTAQTVSFTVTP